MFKKYIEYLKDNPEGYWFKRKIWGWGWTPATWQGWLSIIIYLALIVTFFNRIDARSHSGSDTLYGCIVPFIVITLILVALCYIKGESPRWQWGIKENN